MDYKEGKLIIEQKVEDFHRNEKSFLDKSFQETEVRNRFIDPLFMALGWEFDQTGLQRRMWDVHREFSQRDNSSTKKPDYAFRVDGRVKFFVEAKAPWVSLEEKGPVFQAKRYAFSTAGKTPVVVLTDFQEFRVFNSLSRPVFDNPLQGLIKEYDLKYTEYLDKWDLLYGTFSKEVVRAGSLDRLAGKISKNTKSIDAEFLADITDWREALAKNIAIRNRSLSVDDINEAVQRILDRLIFIRNLEDRGIEEEGLLSRMIEKKEDEAVYSSLIPVFQRLDGAYNGLLFKRHFSEELEIDGKVIKSIVKNLCWPASPFQFDIIEPEILGRIYEKFLGSKIRLTEEHRAKVEEKPEVRKAGGVYYTPEYIVRYIVENTVGETVKGKSPDQIAAIRILDPACGSGSFLIGAFDYLVEYHRQWYMEHRTEKKYKNDWYETPDKDVRLTIQKKRDILKNNIFGVDIDREATEVAIMSLYLKLLEEGFDKGEAQLFVGTLLPDMSGNIKCGNSLIGTDFYNGSIEFDNTEFKQIKPFNWEDEYQAINMKYGFDCVIGNPPYILIQDVHRDDNVINYFKEKYYSSSYKIDTYHIFIERGLRLLNKTGLMGYITPSNYLTNNGLGKMREYILNNSTISILNIITGSVFIDAAVDTCISVFSKNKQIKSRIIFSIWNDNTLVAQEEKTFDQKSFLKNEKFLFTSTESITIDVAHFFLGEKYNVNFGIQLRDRTKFPSDVINETQKNLITKDHKKCYTGKDVNRYYLGYSNLLAYVNRVAKCGGCWDEKAHETNPKIIVRQIGEYPIFRSADTVFYSLNTVFLITPKDNAELSVKFILGILNSKFIKYYWKKVFYDMRKTFPKIKGTYLEKLPIPSVNTSDNNYLEIITLVEKTIKLHKDIINVNSEADKDMINKQIKIIDKKIDLIVYQLYDLSEVEINKIEDKS